MTEPASHPGRHSDWRIVVYTFGGLAILLLVASLCGDGTGMFGSRFMMGAMWVWGLSIFFGLVLLGYFMDQHGKRGDR